MKFFTVSFAAALAVGACATLVKRSTKKDALPPLSPVVLKDLEQRTDYKIFNNDLGLIRRFQEAVDSPDPVRRGAALSGLQTTCTVDSCLALTFDDGPYLYHKDIRQQFIDAGLKTTFFVNGNNYRCIYDDQQAKAILHSVKAGMQIAAHSWSHPHLIGLTTDELRKQVYLLEDALWRIGGVVPSFIRLPYGETNDTITQFLNDQGYVVVTWSDNANSGDGDGESADYSINVFKQLKAPEQALALQHETKEPTAHQVVPAELKIVFENGYKKENIMTVAESFNLNPYKVVGTPGSRDEHWTCAGTPAPGDADAQSTKTNIVAAESD